jgi:hypothetical protein
MDIQTLPTLPNRSYKISIHPKGSEAYKEDYKKYIKEYTQEHKDIKKANYLKYMNKYTDEERKELTKLYNRRKYLKKILNQQNVIVDAI